MKSFKSIVAGLVLALGLFGAVGAQAAPMKVTSLQAFNSAIGEAPVTTDNFSGSLGGVVQITFDSGVVSTLAGGSDFHGIAAGNFFALLGNNGNFYTLTWTFPVPVIGVFFDEVSFGQFGNDPELTMVSILGSGVSFNTEGTFGVVDNMNPFTQIQFSTQDTSLPVVMAITSLQFAAAPAVVAVPEPATLAIFGIGLAGLVMMRRQTKKTGSASGRFSA